MLLPKIMRAFMILQEWLSSLDHFITWKNRATNRRNLMRYYKLPGTRKHYTNNKSLLYWLGFAFSSYTSGSYSLVREKHVERQAIYIAHDMHYMKSAQPVRFLELQRRYTPPFQGFPEGTLPIQSLMHCTDLNLRSLKCKHHASITL